VTDSLSRTLARYVVSLNYESLPPEVVDKIKASLLHALIASIIGAGSSQGQTAIALAKEVESKPDGATILIDGNRTTLFGAAFANSNLMTATGQADSYNMLIHPGPCIIPAALATAEIYKKSGQELITALAAGYEVQVRIAGDFLPSTQARGFRSSPVYGTLGSAVTTGKLLGLTEDQLVTTIALACSYAGGINEGPRSGGRETRFQEPNASRNGIMASLISRENIRGSEASLEGDAGFYYAFVGDNHGHLSYVFSGSKMTSLDSVTSNLGSHWELMNVKLKIYPTAGYNCPVIDLMAELRAKHDLPAESIVSITVDMNWLETLYPSPAFPNAARRKPRVGSTHFYTAYTCVYGCYPPLKSRIEPGGDSPGEDSVVMDLMQRVDVVGHQDRPPFAPRITIHTKNGTTYQGEFKGDELKWNLTMEIKQIRSLFDDLSWARDKLEDIVHTVSILEQESHVDRLISLCVR